MSQREQGAKVHLSEMERTVLNWIGEQGKRRPKQIAVGLGLKPPSVRRTLQQLRDKDLITKNDDETYELLNGSQTDLDSKGNNDLTEGKLDTPADQQTSIEQPSEDLRPHPVTRDVGKDDAKATTVPKVDRVSTQLVAEKVEHPVHLPRSPLVAEAGCPPLEEATGKAKLDNEPSRPVPSSAENPTASSPSNSPRNDQMCPRCAGKKILKDITHSKRHNCRECGFAFNESLKIPACPRCGCTEFVSRKSWRRPTKIGGRIKVLMRCRNEASGCRKLDVSFPLYPNERYRHYPPKIYASATLQALDGAYYDKIAATLKHDHDIDVKGQTVRRWVLGNIYRARKYLLSLPMRTSGFIYLDEKYRCVLHTSKKGYTWRQKWWIWSSYDTVRKTPFQCFIRKTRGLNDAYQLILATLQKAIPPDDGPLKGQIHLWCDDLDKYRFAYRRGVKEGKIDPEKVHLIQVSKKDVYSCINEIEGFNSRLGTVADKLKPWFGEDRAQTRLDGFMVQYIFIEPVPEFEGKTRAVHNEVDLHLGEFEWEKIATLEQILKLEKFKNYQLKVNVPDAKALREMTTYEASPPSSPPSEKPSETENATKLQTPATADTLGAGLPECHKVENHHR